MAYTNETTHYGLPLPTGSDLTVPMDYNESFEEIDTVIFEAQTNASGAVGTAGNALDVANAASTAAAEAKSTAAGAVATASAAATAANEAVAAVAEAKDDALDMICAVVEETATAQYKHEPTKDGLNYYFRYNDILYKTTAVINVGETIVPNTNCSATNVATELTIENGEAVEPDYTLGTETAITTDILPYTLPADGILRGYAPFSTSRSINVDSMSVTCEGTADTVGRVYLPLKKGVVLSNLQISGTGASLYLSLYEEQS